eukprot:scaffold40574_cov27-Tisochrysis_lutea.AAC.7
MGDENTPHLGGIRLTSRGMAGYFENVGLVDKDGGAIGKRAAHAFAAPLRLAFVHEGVLTPVTRGHRSVRRERARGKAHLGRATTTAKADD